MDETHDELSWKVEQGLKKAHSDSASLRSKQAQTRRVSLHHTEQFLTSDVALTSANVFYDGPTVSLDSSGTWMLHGSVTLDNTNANPRKVTAKLWNGVRVIASAEHRIGANNIATIHLSGFVPGGAWRISVAANGTGVVLRVTPTENGTGCDNTTTYIKSVKLVQNVT